MNKVKFETVLSDGGESRPVTLALLPPSARDRQQASLHRGKVYGEALRAGLLLKQQLDAYLRDRDLWDQKRQAEYDRLRKSILEGERLLETKKRADGSPVRLADARAAAIRMGRERRELQDLLSVRSEIEQNTADAHAEQAYFNYLVAACTVYHEGPLEGKHVFTRDRMTPSVDDYVERSSEPAAYAAASKLNEALYGSVDDVLRGLPENVFLKQYKLVDDDFNFVDRDGNRVDSEGRRVDDEGYLVDGEGRRVDADGTPLDGEGRYASDGESFFLDDDGNPVKPESE